jgi:nitrous oxidase accessory protein NosD
VDGSYTGWEEGTVTQPFNTVIEGAFAVRRGTAHTLYIEAGSYNEQIIIDKAMTVRSRNGVVILGQ